MIDLFFRQASHLNWPLTNRPAAMLRVCLLLCHQCQHFPFIFGEWICGITILKITQFRPIYYIFTLGNCRLFRFLQTLFAQFLKCIRPLLTVLCARLLKLLIAFHLFSSSPHLSRQQTASFPHWLVRTMAVVHVDATPRVVLCEGAASNLRILLE